MDALDKALEESIRKQREGQGSPRHAPQPSPGTRHKTAIASHGKTPHGAIDPFSLEARLLRAESEDDDGYDPYSDYMDQLARGGSYENDLEEDPWR